MNDFMASLEELATSCNLDLTVASPASRVMGGSTVSLLNQGTGSRLSDAELEKMHQRQQCLAARKNRRR
ncbi:hypothetical protein [Aeromonas caviae]|uniref:hypothetical protein n=1 Tax=Aeromonas caviae TaxID=648 RepID=UPI0038CFCF09